MRALTASTQEVTPILVVTFRNTRDVLACIKAVRLLDPACPGEMFLCENGGAEAFRALTSALAAVAASHCPGPLGVANTRFSHIVHLQVNAPGQIPLRIHVGLAVENLGYAGGVNAWLEPLLEVPGWSGAWILNPDAEPEPTALLEMISHTRKFRHGMVGSRLVTNLEPHIVHSRGLAWARLRASTISVDLHRPAAMCPPPQEVEQRLDAPSGASIYATRACIKRIGVMEEKYFLYFEDLEWGLRAKRHCGVGYAHGSIVRHAGGTTIGTSTSRAHQSSLAVYLEFRNRLLFVRRHFRLWLPWTLLVQTAELVLHLRAGKWKNMVVGLRGMLAGLAGQTGRPDAILAAHLANSKTGADEGQG